MVQGENLKSFVPQIVKHRYLSVMKSVMRLGTANCKRAHNEIIIYIGRRALKSLDAGLTFHAASGALEMKAPVAAREVSRTPTLSQRAGGRSRSRCATLSR